MNCGPIIQDKLNMYIQRKKGMIAQVFQFYTHRLTLLSPNQYGVASAVIKRQRKQGNVPWGRLATGQGIWRMWSSRGSPQ